MTSYPRIEERVLGAPERRMLRGFRRPLTDLPAQRPSSVLVAIVDGQPVMLPGRSALREGTNEFVNASSIVVLDVRPQQPVVATVTLDSRDRAEPFEMKVTFRCGVTDPLLAAQHAPPDLPEFLTAHIRQDRTLLAKARDFGYGEEADFGHYARTRLPALCAARPPHVLGMRLEFSGVTLTTPGQLVSHVENMRRERHRQELEILGRTFTKTQAVLLEAILARGPEAVEALYLESGDERYAKIAERGYAERHGIQERLRVFVQNMAERGSFDTVALDTGRLIDTFLRSLVDPQSAAEALKDSRRSFAIGDEAPTALGSSLDDDDSLDQPPSPADDESFVDD